MSLPADLRFVAKGRPKIRGMQYELPCSLHRSRRRLQLTPGLLNVPKGAAWILLAAAFISGFVALHHDEYFHLPALCISITCAAGAIMACIFGGESWLMEPDRIVVNGRWKPNGWGAEELKEVRVVDQYFSVTYQSNFRSQPLFQNQANLVGKGILLHIGDDLVDLGGSVNFRAVHRIAQEIGAFYGVPVDDPEKPATPVYDARDRWALLLLASCLVPIGVAWVILLLA